MIDLGICGICGVVVFSIIWMATLKAIATTEPYYRQVRDAYSDPYVRDMPPKFINEYITTSLILMGEIIVSFISLAFLLLAIAETISIQ